MAELADAADSKSADLRVLGVRLPLPAPAKPLAPLASYCTLPMPAAGAPPQKGLFRGLNALPARAFCSVNRPIV